MGAITLVYAESGRRYFEADVALAEDIARRAATAVDNARLYAELQTADRRKNEFLAMLAHELRNPLAPIATAARVIREGSLDGRTRHASEVIERQVGHMTGLIDDLLDVSRVTRGIVQIAREPVDIKGVISAAAEQVQPLIEQRAHRLTTAVSAESLVTVGDRSRLVQAVANLLNNAAKYTPVGGLIELSAESDGETIVVEVKDSGIGIDRSLLPHVFEPFVQAERTSDRTQGGLGLGLALVRNLVRLHGGEAKVWSAGINRGSAFTITLPRVHAGSLDEMAEQQRGHAPTQEGGHRILLVDDNRDGAEMLAEVVRLYGHTVQCCHTGEDALRMAERWPANVFILDIGLPDIDGHELARRLRAHGKSDDATFIALTGYGQDEDRQRAKEAGFDVHMVKPPDLQRLLQILSTEVLSGGRRPDRARSE